MRRRQTKETGPGPTRGDSAHARIHVNIFRCTVAVGAGRWLASALVIRESGIAKHEAACRGMGCACNFIASAKASGVCPGIALASFANLEGGAATPALAGERVDHTHMPKVMAKVATLGAKTAR